MKKIIQKINTANSIAVFCHSRPDADATGSLCALAEGLKLYGKKVDAYLYDPKKSYSFLNFTTLKKCNIKKYDLLIAVDVAAGHMLEYYENCFKKHSNTIAIDHHKSRTSFATLEYIEENVASTCEIIFKLLNMLKIKISPQIATALYLGVSGDTGCFMHDNTTKSTHVIAAKLFDLGADYKLVNRISFKSSSKERFSLIKKAIDKFEYYKDVLLVSLSQEDFKSINYNPVQGVDLIDFISGIEKINFTVLMTERKPGVISLSIRSTEKYDSSKFATIYGGGGHKQAAGCRDILGDFDSIKNKLKQDIKHFIKGKK